MDWPEIYVRLQRDRNDADAWRALEMRVRSWARRDLWELGWHALEDAVADTSAAVALGFARAYGSQTFDGFVLGLYRNARRAIRRVTQMATVSVDDVSLPAAPDPEPSIDDDALEWLYHCLTKLPPRERQAVDLRFFRDASQEEIARVLGVTTGNARRIVFNGVVRLRQCIQRARVENEEG